MNHNPNGSMGEREPLLQRIVEFLLSLFESPQTKEFKRLKRFVSK